MCLAPDVVFLLYLMHCLIYMHEDFQGVWRSQGSFARELRYQEIPPTLPPIPAIGLGFTRCTKQNTDEITSETAPRNNPAFPWAVSPCHNIRDAGPFSTMPPSLQKESSLLPDAFWLRSHAVSHPGIPQGVWRMAGSGTGPFAPSTFLA